MTSAGRLVKLNVLELPALCSPSQAPGAGAASLAGGTPVTEFASFGRGETVVGLCAVDVPGAGVALGTADGVVKRVLPDYPQNRDEFELITLKDGDRVVGAVRLAAESAELVFITSDAQLLRFGAASVARRAGRPGTPACGCRRAPRWCGSVRWTRTRRPGRRPGRREPLPRRGGHGGGQHVRAARSGGQQRQGDPAARVPRQGPRHRRRALPPVPQGRGRAGGGVGRASPGGGRDRRRGAGRAARPGGEAGRRGVALSGPLALLGGSVRVV